MPKGISHALPLLGLQLCAPPRRVWATQRTQSLYRALWVTARPAEGLWLTSLLHLTQTHSTAFFLPVPVCEQKALLGEEAPASILGPETRSARSC